MLPLYRHGRGSLQCKSSGCWNQESSNDRPKSLGEHSLHGIFQKASYFLFGRKSYSFVTYSGCCGKNRQSLNFYLSTFCSCAFSSEKYICLLHLFIKQILVYICLYKQVHLLCAYLL